MAKPKESVELKEGYYLDNFERLLAHVFEVYSDLLPKRYHKFNDDFAALSENAKRLFVRLSMRTKSFYRAQKLNYQEIKWQEAVRELEEASLLEVNPLIEWPGILDPFTVSELKEFYKELTGKRAPKGKREDLLQAFTMLFEEREQECYELLFKHDTLLWPLFSEEWEILKLLFFGSRFQDMEQFILEDLGVMRFEPIVIDKENRLYHNWNEVKVSYLWSNLHAELWEACALKEREEATLFFNEIKKLKFKSSPLKRRYSRSANLYGKLLESLGEAEEAKKIYATSLLEPARERLARLLLKEDKAKEALRLCEDILETPQSESERYFARFFREKVKKALGLDYEKLKRLKLPPESPVAVTWERGKRVEEQVLSHLMKEQGFRGFYCENYYFSTLSALLFWREYWKSAPGVFYHPFEQAPRDLKSGGFFIRMEEELNERADYWRSLSKKELIKEVLSLYDVKKGVACRLCHWKRVEKSALKLLLNHMPLEDLLKITLQILKDPRQYQSGFPDLFLVDSNGGFFLGEVKSPNDSIQVSQKRWIDLFLKWSLPFAILRTK